MPAICQVEAKTPGHTILVSMVESSPGYGQGYSRCDCGWSGVYRTVDWATREAQAHAKAMDKLTV